MTLTSNCDAIGIFPEDAFNKIIDQVMYQMPATFNYATEHLIKQKLFCSSIYADPVLEQMGKTIVTQIDQIPVFGTDSGYDFCLQVKDLKLDLHPSNTMVLPPELGGLAVQQFALSIKICAGLACGSPSHIIYNPKVVSSNVAKASTANTIDLKNLTKKKISEVFNMDKGIVFNPMFVSNLNCFCLEVFAKLTVVNDSNVLSLKLIGLEIKEIEPVALENIIECYVKKLLQETVFPKMKIAMSKLVFGLDSYATVMPMPTSSAIPFNPSVTNNNLTVYLKVQ
ncbi:hypothetical protein [Perlabentimonas gracilis]|uniref:hypothetical protein n=1 Tax=Perlabentimonas gracilis TaxID=2715279 RepID=UPI00140B98E3|nr:hypothetical protein [Perlabentimonas gracilis]NHB69802.1 hypothetical protein [Perlabentimonas gracilis]